MNITWQDAEKHFPECAAAFDRDVGELLHWFKLYMVPIDAPTWLSAEFLPCEGGIACNCHVYNLEEGKWYKMSDLR